MRLRLMPSLEKIFPRAVEHLVNLALRAQANSASNIHSDIGVATQLTHDQAMEAPSILLGVLGAMGLKARRPHWDLLKKHLSDNPNWSGKLDLPGGWRLSRDKEGWNLRPLESK
jgi:hypothetical protein